MNPFDYFDKIFCINLPHDFERKEVMNKTFRDLGIYEKVFWCFADKPYDGIDLPTTNTRVSSVCSQSTQGVGGLHRSPRSRTVSQSLKTTCTLMRTVIACCKRAYDNVPDDWDILYLGGRPLEKLEHVQGNIYKVNKFTSAMSYCISAKALRQYVLFYIDRMGRGSSGCCCDNILNDFIIHNGKNGYVMYPNLTLTIPELHSTLRDGYRDYRDVIQKSWDEHL